MEGSVDHFDNKTSLRKVVPTSGQELIATEFSVKHGKAENNNNGRSAIGDAEWRRPGECRNRPTRSQLA